MIIEVKNETSTRQLGEKLGSLLKGGETIELVGDVGAGKTTFVKGVAIGMGVSEDVQSPSFTINRVYDARDGLRLAHYDFYRLNDAGIMSNELAEVVNDEKAVAIIEWADIVEGVLPEQRISIWISAPSEEERRFAIHANEALLQQLS